MFVYECIHVRERYLDTKKIIHRCTMDNGRVMDDNHRIVCS